MSTNESTNTVNSIDDSTAPINSTSETVFDQFSIWYSLYRILFDYEDKLSLIDITSVLSGSTFIIGSIIFICLIVIAWYLDSSLRNQIFFVFDNCTNEDYNHEYVIKIRFGLPLDFTPYTDLIIEFYNDKFKPLSKFVIVGSYLENGLNIGTKTHPGMKLTSLYLFKYNSLTNLEYCRAYLKTNDENMVIQLYSIEVGTNKEVHLFLFNHGINRTNPNATQVLTTIDEPVIARYNGPLMETSYQQASLFIYSFFLISFFLCRVYPASNEKITIVSNFKINKSLMINSIITALIPGFMYLILRAFIHAQYASSNGNSKWYLIEKLYVSLYTIVTLYLAVISILTEYQSKDEEAHYFYLISYTNLTLLFWLPIAFFAFHIFSSSNYHIGRIIMKNRYHGSEKSRFRKKNRRNSKAKPIKKQEGQHIDENGNKNGDNRLHSKMRNSIKPTQSNQFIATNTPLNYYTPAISYQQGAYVPIFDPNMIPQPKNRFMHLPSPVTYINDPQFMARLANPFPVNLPVQQHEINNLKLHANMMSPYKGFKRKIEQHSQMSIVKPVGQMRDKLARRRSSENGHTINKLMPTSLLDVDSTQAKMASSVPEDDSPVAKLPLKKSSSKTSIGSTGSDYYATMFKDGKIPKVGSISQYGSLLRQMKE